VIVLIEWCLKKEYAHQDSNLLSPNNCLTCGGKYDIMLKTFLEYIEKEQLFRASERVLLAVSGGVDSMVLMELFRRSPFIFGVAHCNFQLRGEASDGDEQFVEEMAAQIEVPFFSTSFPTTSIAKKEKKGIQEAARDLRYSWLKKTARQEKFDHIATAHHLNDAIETLLFNMGRSGSIRAFRSILPKQEQIIRPLLFATKEEIVSFAKTHELRWREDVSNAKDDYTRNRIRHQVVPALKAVHPNLEQSLLNSFEHLRATEQLFDWAVETIKAKVWEQQENVVKIDFEQLLSYPAPTTILFECLSPFGFTSSDVAQIFNAQIGREFHSSTHVLLKDRTHLFLRKKIGNKQEIVYLQKEQHFLQLPDRQLIIKYTADNTLDFERDSCVAYFDADQLQFPLEVRHWRAGDRFQPLGMNGKHKKLQDYFSDQKLSRWEKEQVWLLVSNKEIVWVIGYRSSEAFKIISTTQRICCIQSIQ
jgi:tRNA(Ile)-lysidine synthase